MNLESKPLNSTERFQASIDLLVEKEKKQLIRKLAADWLAKEIDVMKARASVMASTGGDVSEFEETLNTVVSWILGDYVSRWHDPVMHRLIIKEVETRPGVQRFVSGRLPLLATFVEGLERPNEATLGWFEGFHLFPRTDLDRMLGAPKGTFPNFPEALVESVNPDVDYLKVVFGEHHWLVLLLFCVGSFQFMGYDLDLLKTEV